MIFQPILSLFASRRTEDGTLDRRYERLRRTVLTVMAALLARLGSVAALLITVPLTLQHLGPERFGMWMVISAFAAVMTFADFGIGNGVLNRVAAASAGDDRDEIVRATSNGMVVLAAIGATITAITLLSYRHVAWERIFQVTSVRAVAEAGPAVVAVIASLVVSLPASLASKVQLGLQQGYAAQLWVGLGGVLALIGVLVAIQQDVATPGLVLAFFGSQAAALVLNSIIFFCFQRPDLKPRLSAIDPAVIRALLAVGMSFFVLQLVQLVTFRVDAIIVTQYFGPEQAGIYATADRLFVLASMLVLMALSPLWPAYGEAAESGDLEWLRRTLIRSVALAAGGTFLFALVILIFNREIFSLWLGRATGFPLSLMLGFAVWRTLEAAGIAIAMLMNGLGAVRMQAALAIGMAVTATGLKILVAVPLGIAWITWMTSFSYLCWFLLPSTLIVPWLFRRLGARGASESGRQRIAGAQPLAAYATQKGSSE